MPQFGQRDLLVGGEVLGPFEQAEAGPFEDRLIPGRDDGVRVSIIMPGSVSTYFNDHTPGPGDAWKFQPEDVARAVVDLLAYPGNALASRVELRPSRPPKT